MKNLKKITAAVIAVAMLTVFAGCGGDQSWSYKTDTTSLSAGTYIYNLLNAYYEAYDLVESPDEASDILSVNVTDSDGETKTVEQYAYDVADETTNEMVAVEQLFKDYGLELNKTEYDSAVSYASQLWANIKDQFEIYGISQDSFNYAYAEYTVKYGQVFEYLYGKDGEKYVSDDELTTFFKDNYTGYAYFSLSMAETDDEGNSVAKSDEEFAKAETNFNSYADSLNKGTSYKDVVTKYTTDYELTTDPTYSGALDLENNTSSISDDVKNALKELDEGKAKVVKTGEGATTLYYLVYRPAADTIIDFLDEDSDTDTETDAAETADTASDSVYIYELKSGFNHYTLLSEMKGDDFTEYLNDFAASLNISKNDTVINKFKPKMFVSDGKEK